MTIGNFPRYPWNANHSEEQPCRMIVYDTETVWQDHSLRSPMQEHRWRLAVASYWTRRGAKWTKKGMRRFHRPELFWEYLYTCLRPREPLWVFAHNATFDFTVAGGWKLVDDEVLKLKTEGSYYPDRNTGMIRQARDWKGRMAVDSLPFILETAHVRGKCIFTDTMNYLPVSLDAISKWVGMSKLPLPPNEGTESDWYARCERDVEITESFVHKLMGLWKDEKLGNWQPTLAGLSYSAFRHLCPDSGIVAHGDCPAQPASDDARGDGGRRVPPDCADTAQLERDAYYGARVLPAFIGDCMPAECLPGNGELFGETAVRSRIDGPVSVYDVNGLYASVMYGYTYPIELLHTEWEVSVHELATALADHPVIARVRIASPDAVYPVVDNGRTVYANGHYVTTLCGPELSYAVKHGHVTQVHQLAHYYSGTPFERYVEYWWRKRVAAIHADDDVTAKLCKNMINSLFGKLGQRTALWQRDDTISCLNRWGPFLANPGDGRGLLRCRGVGGVTQVVSERRDCRHTFTAAAAYVTSYARVYMDLIRQALPPKSVLYQDTDSLFLLPNAAKLLESSGWVHPTDLGKFKFQGTYQFVSIHGPKNYSLDGRNVVAGLRPGAEPAGERLWRQWAFERAKSVIGREPDGSIWAWQQVFTAAKHVSGVITTPSGWTQPVTLHR